MIFSEIRWGLLLPDGHRIIDLLTEHPGHFLDNWWATFSVSATASVLALALALIIAVLALRFKVVDIFVTPFVALSQSFPLQAIAPLIIILLGIGFQTKATVAFIIAFFPIYGTCLTALKTTPKPILAHLAISHSTFNKGQRVEVAKALSFQPGLLLLDEALSGIDSNTKREVAKGIWGEVVREKITVVGTAHQIGDLLMLAQRVYLIDSGKIKEALEVEKSVSERLDMEIEALYKLESAKTILKHA